MYKTNNFLLVICCLLNIILANISYAAYDDYANYQNLELLNSPLSSNSNNKFYFQKGNVNHGKEIYKMCVGCHLSSAAGKSDGSFPQLAGQHASVIIKQLEDIKNGLRNNPTMYPFATLLNTPKDLVDVATYLENLCQSFYQGKYNQSDKDKLLQIGKNLYQQDCINCHKEHSEGDATKFVPKLAGQHFVYILRQLELIQKNARGNSDKEMQKIVESYNNEQLKAVSVYISELPKIGKICK